VSVSRRQLAARMARGPAQLGPLLDSGFIPFSHVAELSETLASAALRPRSRTIVNMPPRHGKTLSLVMFLVWFLEQNPHARVIFVSYSAELAIRTSRTVRNLIEINKDILSIRLSGDSSAADRWDLTTGGGVLAAGIDSRVTGWGGDLIVVDDPHADIAAARNPRAAEAVYRYYRDTLLTRLQAGGRVMLVGHRLAVGDLFGRVLEDEPEDWTTLSQPAVNAAGEALCPELFPVEEASRRMVEVGPHTWSAQYQQEPRSADGEWFPADVTGWATTTDAEVPANPRHRVRAWDMAATTGGDWTVGVRMCAHEGAVYVEDVVRFRGSPAEVERRIRATAEADGSKTVIRIPRDPGSAGVAVADRYVREVLSGYTVIPQPVTGSKVTRAEPLSAAVSSGQVRLVSRSAGLPAPWWDALVTECASFPGGRHDDVVDAAADALAYLQSKARKGSGGYYKADPKAYAEAARRTSDRATRPQPSSASESDGKPTPEPDRRRRPAFAQSLARKVVAPRPRNSVGLPVTRPTTGRSDLR